MSLRAIGLGKRLGGRWILEDLDLSLEGGALHVAGPNGCGKSTLLKLVAGVLSPDRGFVTVGGATVPSPKALARVGYVPEAADPPEHLTVGELLALVAALKRATPPDPAMGAGDLLGQRVGSLSLGQRRRACIAAALVGDPWLLILDEPENGLDVAGTAELVALVRAHLAGGGAALFATHDAAFAEAIATATLPLPR